MNLVNRDFCLKLIIIFCLSFYIDAISARRIKTDVSPSDTLKAKKGWNVGPFPAVGYNSDLGFQYGAYCELYNFGDGILYPGYYDKFSFEISRYTKGSGVYAFTYDSPQLWKNHRVLFNLAWLPEKMCDFYGYNGYQTPYIKDVNKSFYKMSRKQLRLLVDIQGKIKNGLNWMVGVAWQRMVITPVSLKKYAGADNLYSHYLQAGLINSDEARGGNVLQLKSGMVYDSRDIEADPTKGMFGEFIVAFAPDIIDRRGYTFLKTNFSFSYYQPIWNRYITMAARLSAQFTPLGKAPYYIQSNITTMYLRQTFSEGLGGNYSLRGILRNRIVGNGMGWLNLELRFRSKTIRLIRQNWYLACNPFMDAGTVLQPYRTGVQKLSSDPYIYSGDKEAIHLSTGIGIKLVMNHNFILSAEWAKAIDHRDGTSALSLGLNYLF